ncbi:DUF6380 family protein [Streptomyces fuscichromogenes]
MDKVGQGDSTGDKRQATLRHGVASLTATARPVPFNRRGGRPGEAAR